MTTLVEHLSNESMQGGKFVLAFTVGAVVGTAVAAALVALTL